MMERFLKRNFFAILEKSLEKALASQGLKELKDKLMLAVPDIFNQYSTFKIDNNYIKAKVRSQHAFQISLVSKIINDFQKPVIVDIGDSAGTHLRYITSLFGDDGKIKCLGVNMDISAVKRIKDNGLEAIYARAEDLTRYNIHADIFLCFETLEHIMDPCRFLYQLSSKTQARYLVITVPYLKKSRVGLRHIRKKSEDDVCAENTHIFELNPQDWRLLIQHSGWKVKDEALYLQYPRRGLLRLTGILWKRFDYEGFYGMILERDSYWADKYTDWKASF